MRFEELQSGKLYFAKTNGDFYVFKTWSWSGRFATPHRRDMSVDLIIDECYCLCNTGLISRSSFVSLPIDTVFYEIDENVIAQLRHIYNNSCISAKAIMDRTKESIKH